MSLFSALRHVAFFGLGDLRNEISARGSVKPDILATSYF